MKKRKLFLIVGIFILTVFLFGIGLATKVDFSIEQKDVVELKLENITILKQDYEEIINLLNCIHPSRQKQTIEKYKILKVTTKEEIYEFHISDKNILSFEKDGQTYYSKNKNTIKKINQRLQKIKKQYQNEKFYSIKYQKELKQKENDLIIKIDNVNEYFIVESKVDIKKLQIHKVERKENEYHDIEPIYTKENISNGQRVVIRMNPIKDYYQYRISITNLYGVIVSIIPTYDLEKESGKLIYITNVLEM